MKAEGGKQKAESRKPAERLAVGRQALKEES